MQDTKDSYYAAVPISSTTLRPSVPPNSKTKAQKN